MKIVLFAVAALACGALYWWLSETGALSMITDPRELREWVDRTGFWGPFLVVALMVVAIVVSPIPSGPIAVVSGAAFGPVWGTVYVVIGSTGGAMIAFLLARALGYEFVERWSRTRSLLARLKKDRSQTWLMLVVFGSRLIPFISFDAMSYAAGLTPLAFWRFALATFAGVIPISFLLAYFGEEMVTSDSSFMMIAVVVVGGVTLVPIGVHLLRKRKDGKSTKS